MPKVIQMPRHTEQETQDRKQLHRPVTSLDTFTESESLSKMQRWLDLADSALENKSESDEKRPAV